jgi:hypothetical protein
MPGTTRKRITAHHPKKLFDKYALYKKAVQSPDVDVEFLRKVYKDLRKKEPVILREDFCGTYALSCEWVKLGAKFSAVGVDIDPEPLDYGKEHYFSKLTPQEQSRLKIVEANVLTSDLPPADIAAAMNFSYFIFKTRQDMKIYFTTVYRSLKAEGLFVADLFGGSLCMNTNEESTSKRSFIYYWDQESYDPVTHRAVFHIHFKVKGSPKKERVFTYDWRMWSIPEIREIMIEAGFRKTHVYWEGTNKSGGGNGVFTRTKKGEACESWIAYVVGEK